MLCLFVCLLVEGLFVFVLVEVLFVFLFDWFVFVVGRRYVCLFGWLVCWSKVCLVVCLFVWFVGRRFGCLFGWLKVCLCFQACNFAVQALCY